MAIVNDDGSFSGGLGDYRFYKLNGKNVVATKGGPKPDDIKKKASFAITRAHNAEFGIVCKVSNAIFRSHVQLRSLRHPYAHQFLRSYLFRMFSFDTSSAHGQRSLLFSEADHHFEPMQLTTLRYPENVSLPVVSAQGANESLTFTIPSASSADRYFKFPTGCNQVRWSLYVQGIQDIIYDQDQKEYSFKPEHNVLNLTPVAHFDYFKRLPVDGAECRIQVSKDFHYLVYAVATFTSRTRPQMDPIHTASCIRVIAGG
jgi:hypothetical protein